jgi:hypothetical protein
MTIWNYLLIALVILLIVGITAYIIWTYKTKGKDAAMNELREIAYQLFLKAEKIFGRDMGKSKMQWVVGQFYRLIAPGWMAKLLPETTVQEFLQDAYYDYYYRLKDYLDDGQVNGSPPKEAVDTPDTVIDDKEPAPTPTVYPSPPGTAI